MKKKEKLKIEPEFENMLLDMEDFKNMPKLRKTQEDIEIEDEIKWSRIFNSKYYTQKPK